MIPAWVEAIVPLAIITVAVGAMGGLQGVVQQLVYGKPKPIGADEWDRLVETRDRRVLQEWQQKQS